MAKERKVVFSLEVVEGDGNKQAFANTEAGIKAATAALKEHTAARKEYDRTNAASAKRGSRAGGADSFSRGMDRAEINAAKQAAADERRERERNIADMQRAAQREKQILADRVRANLEASRQIREAARQANADSWRRRQSAASATGGTFTATDSFSDADAKRAVGEIGREHSRAEQAAARHHAQQMKVLGGYVQIGGAITQAARAAIFFGATNEDTAAKMLKMVLYAEGIVSAFSAAKNLSQGMGKVLGGAAGGAVAGTVGGAAGGAGAGLLTKAGVVAGGAVAVAAAKITAGAIAGMLALDAGRSWLRGEDITDNWSDAGTVVTDKLGFTDSVGDHRRGWDTSLSNVRNRESLAMSAARRASSRWSATSSIDAEQWRAGGLGGAITNTQAALAAAQRDEAGVLGNQGSPLSARIAANEKIVELTQRLKDLTREKVQIEVDGDRKSLAASEERLRKVQAERDVRMSQLTAAGSERRGAAVNFALASPAERAIGLQALRQSETGDLASIPLAGLDALAKFGGSQGQSIREAALARQADKTGFEAFNKGIFNPVEQGLMASTRNLSTTIKNEVTVKMELELKTGEEMVNKRLSEAMKPIWDQIRNAVTTQLDLAARQQQQQEAEQIRQAQEAG
jgi:hypothetical protein